MPLKLVVLLVIATGCVKGASGQRSTEAAEQPADKRADMPPLPSVPLPAELERVLVDYESAWAARSPDELARLFTDDGFVMQSGRPPVRGRAAIRSAYVGSGGSLSLRALAFVIEGNLGYIVGAYAKSVGEPDDGKFILLLRKARDGTWQIAADMDNGSVRR